MKRFGKWIQLALFAAGLLLFYFTLSAAGLERLTTLAPVVSGYGLWFLTVYAFMCAWDVAGWQALFSDAASRKVRFGGLYWIRLAGEALNNLTPFLDVGGEFLKVELTAGYYRLGRRTVLASVVVERGILFFSEVFFWIAGLACLNLFLPIPSKWHGPLWFVLGAAFGLGVAFFWAQQRGFFGIFLAALHKIGVNPKLLGRFHLSLREADREIQFFYSQRTGKVILSFFLHLLGWAAGGLEVYVIFHFLGAPIGWVEAMVIESLLHLVKTASFFIPGNLGAQEAGLTLLARALGYDPFLGLALSLLKRFRQLVWTALGLMVWGAFQLVVLRRAPAE